ncbi:transposase [Porphyromonas gulae]|nr:transposase [Porphyromonas gulae]
MKSDHRLGRNFYKGLVGDAMNILPAAAAYNFKRAMKALWVLIKIISESRFDNCISLKGRF